MSDGRIRQEVRERYAERATAECSCCGPAQSEKSVSKAIGYSDEQLSAAPVGANLGLGCGNPTALASLKAGETVLDLGAGAGLDCFLAGRAVGPTGRAIGVDMTPEMIDRARENAQRDGIENVEFRLGEIEHLPVADESVDVVISNCVINLSPDKPQVFREACRVLKPGGRLFISDIVLDTPLPAEIRNSIEAYVECIAGASMRADYLDAITSAGFDDVEVLADTSADAAFEGSEAPTRKAKTMIDGEADDPSALGLDDTRMMQLTGTVSSITVKASKTH